jgi:hypothetical protein
VLQHDNALCIFGLQYMLNKCPSSQLIWALPSATLSRAILCSAPTGDITLNFKNRGLK